MYWEPGYSWKMQRILDGMAATANKIGASVEGFGGASVDGLSGVLDVYYAPRDMSVPFDSAAFDLLA